jgi:hypothetical protein
MQQVILLHKPALESKASLLLIPPAVVRRCMLSCSSHGRCSHDFGSDGSSSETGSSGSESCPSPTNLDENGLLGAVIFSHCNDAAHGSSPSSSMAAKGMLHHETILADGSAANTQVSARILKKRASKCQQMDPHFPLAEGDECKSMDEDWDDDDFSSLSTLQSEMFRSESWR